MANERKLKAVLEWAIDKGSLNQVLRALDPLKRNLEEIEGLAQQVSKTLSEIGKKTGGKTSFAEIGKEAKASLTEVNKAVDALEKKNAAASKKATQGVSEIGDAWQASLEKADDYAQVLGEIYESLPAHVKKVIDDSQKAVASIRELKNEFKVVFEDKSFLKIPKTPPVDPLKIEAPTVSDDLSKTPEIASLLENKLEGASAQAKETASAAKTVAENVAQAVNQAEKLAQAEQKVYRTTLLANTQWDAAIKKLIESGTLTDAQIAKIKSLGKNVRDPEGNLFTIPPGRDKASELGNVLDESQRKVLGLEEVVRKVEDAFAGVNQQAQNVTQNTAQAAAQFERIPNSPGGDIGGINTKNVEAFPQDQRDQFLGQLTDAELSVLGYRKVVDGVTQASGEAVKAQMSLEEEIKKIAQKSREGTLSLEEYLDLVNKISQSGTGFQEATKMVDQAGIKPPTEVARKYIGYYTETGDKGEDRLKVEYAIEKSLDKQAATLRDQLSEEERIWEVIKRIASTLGITTRDATQLLANYKGISKETQAMAAKVGGNPQEVTRAKNYRLAQEAAKFAADATAQNASEEQRLANMVNAVGKALKMTTAEAAEFVATMKEGGGKSAQELDKLTRKINETKKAAGGMAGGMRFGIMGFTTQIIGVQIEQFVKPFFQLPNQFAQFAGRSNEAARNWLDNTARIEQAQMRIAQTVSKAILPAMEQFAKWLEEAATFAEENPEWVSTLADGAKILLAAAIALKGIGFTFSAIGTAQNLAGFVAKSALGQAAGGALGGAGVSGAIAAVLPFLPVIIAAVASYLAVSKLSLGKLGVEGHDPNTSILNEAKGTFANAMGISAAGGAALGTITSNIIKGKDALEGVAQNMAEAARDADELTRSVLNFSDGAQKASSKLDATDPANPNIIVPDNIIQGIANLLKQMTDLETQYDEERANLIEQYGQERVDLEDKYEKQRQDLIKNYNDQLAELYASYLSQIQDATENYAKQERRAEEDYYRRRALAAAEFGKEIERLEEDHQDRLEKMRRDHLFNVEALVASRDALGLAREMRRYEEERQQEEANYDKEVRRKNEDFADKMKQMEEEFALERARRQEDFEDRLREIEENYQRQKAKLAQQQAERLADLEAQQAEEKKMMEDNLDEQLKLLEERFAKEKANIEKQIADQILLAESLGLTAQNIQYIYDTAIEYFTRLQTLRNQVLSSLNYRGYGGGIPSLGTSGRGTSGSGTTEYYDTGGYITQAGKYGMALDGKPEFVLANPTVKALERGLGSRSLTQDKVLAMTTRPQNLSQTTRIVIDQTNWRIEGALTIAEKRALMREVHEATYQAIRGVNVK